MKQNTNLSIFIISMVTMTACIDTYIENPDDEDSDGNTTVVNSNDFSNSSVEALKDNCATHESSSDYIWESSTEVSIALNGKSATISGSGATANGSIVTINKAGNFKISGSLTDGQIVVNTEDTATVRLILNNTEISCSSSSPILITKAQKTVIVIAAGTSNKLDDQSPVVASGTDQVNGAICSLFNLTICGSGKLSAVSSNNCGIVCSKGLILTTATILITSGNDGIIGKDYLELKSGTVSINSKGDGLKSDNNSDETKGYIAIFSGTVTITSSGDGIIAQTDAVITDGDFIIQSGDITSSAASSSSSKGIKGIVNVIIEKGNISIESADKALLSKGNIAINGGVVTIKTIAEAANGIDSDSLLTVTGGTIDLSITGNQSKAIKSSGTMNLNGGTITINTKGGVVLETSGSGYQPSYCIGIKGGTNVNIKGSDITINCSGEAGKGMSTDGNFNMYSGVLSISTTGNGGTYKNASGTTDAYNASCITSDGTLNLIGGTISLSASGTAGKGISTNGIITIGSEGCSPTLSVTTTGSKITVSGSSSSGNSGFGGGFGGGGSSNANYSSAKAIKSDAAIVINNGDITIASADDGIKSEKSIIINNGSINITKSIEGMESPSITINNGYVSINASDDGFNATAGLTAGGTEQNDGSMLTINGGTIAVSTTTGDGIDSNGSLTITGGTIIVQGPNSQPELGLDVNGTSNVSGGLLVVSGPNSGNMIEGPSTSSSQYSIMTTSSSLGTNMLHVQDNSGSEIATFKPIRSAYYFIVSSANLKKGSNYSFYIGGSSTGTSINGYYSGGTYTAGTLKKTVTVSSKLTTVSF